ncbi:MAG: isochorismatase family protein [Rhodobacteraceae bacterium]|nr:isochorismatase family protein [Paracoccaceae bacterium]
MPNSQLLDRSRAVLAVIDVQPAFVDKLALADRAPLVARIAWLMRVARAMDIPMLAMGEDLAGNGPPVAEVLAELPPGCPVHDKRVFGLAGQPDILAALRATGRDQPVLVGLETDVCVAQSALGLLAEGFGVTVVSDATGAPGACRAAGLARIAAAGASVLTVKSVYYDWLRDLETLAAIKPRIGAALPPGLTL